MTIRPTLTSRRLTRVLSVLAVFLLLSMLAACAIGSIHVDVWSVLSGRGSETDAMILLQTRLPRVLLAAIVGGGLALAGASLQGLLGNPLAEPHLLGISGGAALGAVLGVVLGGRGWLAETALLPAAASVGALLSMAVIYRLGRVHGRLHPHVLLLAGVVYNAFTGALIMCVNALADLLQAQGILFWLMGSLTARSFALTAGIFVYVAVAAVCLLSQAHALNLLALGDDAAMALGVDVERVRRMVFFASSLLVGAVVSVSGMIGFVGLIVPHVVRLLFGADHRLLLPASLLAGASFLVWADLIARVALGSVELPVGVVTALCGGPFFVYLLQREGRRWS